MEPEQKQEWSMLEGKIEAILAFQARDTDRIEKWKHDAQYGELLNGASDLSLLSGSVLQSLVCIERAFATTWFDGELGYIGP